MTAGKIEKIAGDSATFGNTVTASTDGTEISEAGKRRVLCLTKGAGIAPVANYIRWAEGKDRIDVIADLDKISREFAEYALGMTGLCGQACDEPDRADGLCGQGGCELQAGREQSDVANGLESVTYGPLPLNLSWTESEKYDVIIISASDFYQQNIYVPEAKKVLSNNHTMCCGEGICGACMCMDAMGKEHRSCKECRV